MTIKKSKLVFGSPMSNVRRVKKFLPFLLLLILSLLPITWFRGNLIFHGDQGYPLNPWSDFQNFSLFFWNRLLGTGFTSTGGLAAPFSYVASFLSYTGVPLWLTQAFQYYFLFFLAGFSVQYLIKTIYKGEGGNRIAIFSSLAYLFSFYPLFSFWSAFVNLAYFYATVPLLLALYIRYLDGLGSMCLISWLVVATLMASPAMANPAYILLTFFLHFSFLGYFLFGKKKPFVTGIIRSLKLGFLFLLFNAWWILPNYFNIQSSLRTSGAISASGSENILSASSSETSLLNVARFFGPWTFRSDLAGDQYYPWHKVYETPFFIFLGFLGPTIALSILFFKKPRRRLIFFILLYLTGVFLMKGAHSPLGFLNKFIVLKIPYFVVFRNSYEKFGALALLGYSVSFGFGLDLLTRLLFKKSKKFIPMYVSSILVCFLLFGIYMWPYWTGDLIYAGGKIKPSARVSVPEDYRNAQKWIGGQKGDFRLISLPRQVGAAYRWEKGVIGADDPTLRIFGRPVISPFFPSDDLLGSYLDNIFYFFTPEGEKDKFSSLSSLRFTASKYIMVHEDAIMSLNTIPSSLSPTNIKKFLESHGIKLEKSFGSLFFYQLPEEWQTPLFYAATETNYLFSTSPQTYNQSFSLIGNDRLSATFSYRSGPFSSVTSAGQPLLADNKVLTGISQIVYANSDLILPKFISDISEGELKIVFDPGNGKQLCITDKSVETNRSSFFNSASCLGNDFLALNEQLKRLDINENDIKKALVSYQETVSSLVTDIKESGIEKTDYLNLLQATVKNHYRRVATFLPDNELGILVDNAFSDMENEILNIPEVNKGLLVFFLPIAEEGSYQLAVIPPAYPPEADVKIELPSKAIANTSCDAKKCVSDNLVFKEENGTVSITGYLSKDANLIKNNWERPSSQPHIACETVEITQESQLFYLSANIRLSRQRAGVFVVGQQLSDPVEKIIFSSVFAQTKESKPYQWLLNIPSDTTKARLCFYESGSDSEGIFIFDKVKLARVNLPNLFAVQKNDYSSYDYLPKISYQRINPTLYFIDVENFRDNLLLVFSETFHPGWKVYLYEKDNGFEKNPVIKAYFDGMVKEHEPTMKYFDSAVISNLLKKSIADKNHAPANGFANSWQITKDDVLGLKNYSLVIEFTPQRFCYLGVFVSMLSAVLFIITFLRKKS